MKIPLTLLSLPILLAACSTTHASLAPDAARTQFDRMKGLEGRWKSVDGSAPGSEVVYSVTAGGSVLHEELFPGTEHEMITMYHLDGAGMRMTHYCAAQNQPTMALTEVEADGTLVFDCIGGTGFECASDGHMHHMEMTLDGHDHLRTVWTFYEGGQPKEEAVFDLRRQ